jgi:hypothetical protein
MIMADLDASDFARLLGPVAAGLRADGYLLDASIEANQLYVRVAATPQACEECLVPKEVLGGIVESTLRKQGVETGSIEILILYPPDP